MTVRLPTTTSPAQQASLLLVGGSDAGLVGLRHQGNTDLFRLLGEDYPFEELHLTRNLRQMPWLPDLAPFACVLNIITDPDQNPKTLDNLRKLLRGFRGRVINRPEAVLRSGRDQVAKLLAGIPGLLVPKAIRLRAGKPDLGAQAVARAGLPFPLILRKAGTHTGKIVGIMQNLDELRSGLSAESEHFATEFVDFRSPGGLYRKYRVYFFGPRIVLRHMFVSDEWNVHVSVRERFMRHRPDLLEEEARLFASQADAFSPALREVFRQVRRRMPLDFFGLDFGILPDGRAVFFEANATMSFFPVDYNIYPYLKRCIPPAQHAFREMVAGSEVQPATTSGVIGLQQAR
jgi:hypothetical protein